MVHQRNGRAILLYLEACSHHHAQFVHSLDEKKVCNAWSEITTIPFEIALVNIGFECVPVGRVDYD